MYVLVGLVVPDALGLELERVDVAGRLKVALRVLAVRVPSAPDDAADETDPERVGDGASGSGARGWGVRGRVGQAGRRVGRGGGRHL